MATELEKAYLAGLLDGEGHIGVTLSKPRGNGEWRTHALQVTLANTHIETLAWVKSVWGGTLHTRTQPCQRVPIGNSQWTSAAAASLLKEILPYLRVKRSQALLGLQFAEMAQGPRTRFILREEWDQREQLRMAIRQLNRPDPTLVLQPYPDRSVTRTCVQCGKVFQMPYRSNKKYCSKHCVYAGIWSRHKERMKK